MSTQERAVMQQALDALEYKGYGSKARTLKKQAAIAALRQALAEPARTLAEAVTDNPQEVGVMRAHIRQVLAEREALELAEQKTLYALLYARVREQDLLLAQMKSGAPEAPATAELGKAVQPATKETT